MDSRIDIIKGVHPGKFIERELKKKNFSQRALAKGTGIQKEPHSCGSFLSINFLRHQSWHK
jgi:hypothetical protein